MSVKSKFLTGTALAIMLVIGLWVVGSFYNLIGSLLSSTPDMHNAFINLIFFAVGCIILGFYVTTRWYKSKVRG